MTGERRIVKQIGTTAERPQQPPLPPLRHLAATAESAFAHPAELDLSRLLSYYRIRWAYEPTTFALAWGEDGRPSEMFTPDFYLPEQRLYIELTTMRQRLVTRKNRKLRRLRELYPDVRIKLLYRRDYQRLLEAYQGSAPPASPGRISRVLYPAEEIQARIEALADQIAADHQAAGDGAPLVVVSVGRGSDVFRRALLAALTARAVPVVPDRLVLSRYRTLGGAHRVRVRRGPATALAGCRVLLVEDIVSTGLSLAYLIGWLRRQRAATVAVCTLLDRRVARLVDVPLHYAGFEAPDEVLVGFGLALRRQFRTLPYIGVWGVEESPGSVP